MTEKLCLAKENSTPADILEALAVDADERVRASVAANERCPTKILQKLASDANVDVRRCVARNRSTPRSVLVTLAEDSAREVRLGVAWNPRCTYEVLKALSKQPNELLPIMERPAWLTEILNGNVPEKFPLKDILHDSLYYAGSGTDGTPIKHLVGNVYSFVYVDYTLSQREYLQDLKERPPIGYEMVYEREIFQFNNVALLTDETRTFEITQKEEETLWGHQRFCHPFGHWSIWKHKESDLAFSLFFQGGESCALYKALYVQNMEVPKYLAIIQPGMYIWEHVHSDNSHFHDLVMNNPAGMPEFMIWGHYGWREREYLCINYWNNYDAEHIAHLPNRCATVYRLKHRR